MIKNLGKFKQWTGERFGGAKVSMQTDDFQNLEKETEHKRDGYDRIVDAVDMCENHLTKRRTSPEDGKTKVMPFEALGSCLYHYGTVFPDDSALGIALINLGQTETRIASLQEALAKEIKDGYKATLLSGIQEYKEYDYLKKKFASRRLDYDSKLNRLNKAKKEKPELEQEMQAARIKYQETEHDLIQKMAYIQEFENEHRDALLELIEAQCHYHTQANELLNQVKKNWGQGANADPCAIMSNVIPRSNSIDSFHSIPQDSNKLNHRLSTKYQRRRTTPESSLDDQSTTTTNTSNNQSAESLHSQALETTPPLPQPQQNGTTTTNTKKTSMKGYEKYRKALFEFNGQNNDELCFKVGDIIAVIEEIDVGWWLGEVHSKRGIFPVNYTEDYDPQKHPLPSLPPKSASPDLENVLADHPQEPVRSILTNSESCSSLPTLPDPTIPTANLRHSRPPPPPSSVSSPTIQQSSSVLRRKSTAIRPPPPPPPAKDRSIDSTSSNTKVEHQTTPIILNDRIVDEPSHYASSNASSTNSRSNSPIHTSFPAHASFPKSTDEISVPNTIAEEPTIPGQVAQHIACQECECIAYIPNLFKKGHCNNCFHKHID